MILLQRLLFISLFLFILSIASLFAQPYYVSPSGNDTTGTGSIDLPFRTITQAVSVAVAGDTIYLRGGRHYYSAKVSISKVGSSGSKYYLFAYSGERPVLDFSAMVVYSSNRGISLSGQYWHVKGLDIYKAGDNGMHVSGSNNIIEFCSFYENYDTGLQLGNGASNNQVINCDSYFNADPSNGNADGFAPKLDVGSGNYFYGCRAWQNSDDGYDGYLRPSNNITTTYENCWCFKNGYLKSGGASSGNGNGFKMGGSDDKTLMHNVIMKNCLSFDNRVKGFDQNNNKGSMTLYNCTAYRNGTNYGMPGPIDTVSGKVMTLVNCVVLGSEGSIMVTAVQQTNSWMDPPFTTVTVADFESIDTAGVRGPRMPDGSLPDITFMHLASGSQLVDAGTDVGLPYYGSAPDLGAFETDEPVYVAGEPQSRISEFRLLQNYPNPFNPSTMIKFEVVIQAYTKLYVINTLGQEIATLFSGLAIPNKTYSVQFNAQLLPSGVYFSVLESGGKRNVRKMMLIK